MGQDPYGGTGDFTPYQPDATPDSEPSETDAEAPYVPYGGAGADPVVPYGGAAGQFYAASPTPTKSRVLPWVAGLGVLVVLCSGGIGGIVTLFAGSDPDEPVSEEVFVNDLQAGQCLIGAGFATDEPVSGLEIVDCSTAHDAQVLDVNVLDAQEAADYDFDDPASTGAVCRPVLSEEQEALLLGPDYGLVAFTETDTPGKDDKVACLVKRTDGQPIHGFLPAPEPPTSPS